MSPGLHLAIFLAAVGAMQILVALWSHRVSGSTPTTLLIALLPPVGLPYLLWMLRKRLVDNHVAGAITYMALVGAGFSFYFYYRIWMPEDDKPWMLMYTMAIFAFLGIANLVGTRLKD
jgi:ABC-type Fe3+-siderophore transport system permease subunit